MSEEGSLYTWGDGAAQNLGYADTLRQVIPRRVDFGSVQHVLQVCLSCIPMPPYCPLYALLLRAQELTYRPFHTLLPSAASSGPPTRSIDNIPHVLCCVDIAGTSVVVHLATG